MRRVGRTLAIYTEGDARRGLGHVARCTGYAEAWAEQGGRVVWVIDGDAAARAAPGPQAEVIDRAWQGEGRAIVACDAAVVDSYSATPETLAAIAASAPTVFLDDDFRLAYPAGRVVHSAPGPADAATLGEAEWLLGPRWHPMRRPFWDVPVREAPGEAVRTVLVLTGGGEAGGLGARLAAGARRALPEAEIHLVAGAAATGAATLDGVRLHYALDAAAMRDLMFDSDVAVTAAGQAIFELARCGCPAVMVGRADNQRLHMRHWPDTGAAVAAAWADADDLEDRVAESLIRLSVAGRASMSRAGQATIDGQGCRRLMARLAQEIEAS